MSSLSARGGCEPAGPHLPIGHVRFEGVVAQQAGTAPGRPGPEQVGAQIVGGRGEDALRLERLQVAPGSVFVDGGDEQRYGEGELVAGL